MEGVLIKSVENGLQLVDSHQIFGPSNYFALFIFYDLHWFRASFVQSLWGGLHL